MMESTYVGESVRFTVTAIDQSGQPFDPPVLTVEALKPDGTEQTILTRSDFSYDATSGQAVAYYTVDMPGRWRFRITVEDALSNTDVEDYYLTVLE